MKGTNNQYIFKLSSGEILNLFLDFSNNICVSYLKNKLVWSLPKIIIENVAPPFCACISSEDVIHIFSPLSNGNLRHTIYTHEKVYSTPILFSRNNPIVCNGINCCYINDTIHLVYSLRYGDKYILTYQSIVKEEISSPEALGHSDKEAPCVNISSDSSHNLHVLFINSLKNPEHIQISSNNQKTRIPIFESNDRTQPISFMDFVIDINDIFHLCLLANNSLIYIKKSSVEQNWGNSIKISNVEDDKNTSSHLTLKTNKILINWFSNNKPVYSASNNDGLSWSSPAPINLKKQATYNNEYYPNNLYNRTPYFPYLLIHYRSNSNDKASFISNTVPGILYNDFKLAFYDDEAVPIYNNTNISTNNNFNASYKNTPTPAKKDNIHESFKSIFMDTLSSLKEGLENTTELCNENRRAISRIEKQLFELEKDVVLLMKKSFQKE